MSLVISLHFYGSLRLLKSYEHIFSFDIDTIIDKRKLPVNEETYEKRLKRGQVIDNFCEICIFCVLPSVIY